MTLVRMLVDGCGLLHQWTEIAPGKSRLSKAARGALVLQLTRYAQASGVPVTVVFEGVSPENNAVPNFEGVEVLYGRPRQQLIADLAGDSANRGGFRVVTEDPALRDTIFALGGTVLSSSSFIASFHQALARFESSARLFNRNQAFPYFQRH